MSENEASDIRAVVQAIQEVAVEMVEAGEFEDPSVEILSRSDSKREERRVAKSWSAGRE